MAALSHFSLIPRRETVRRRRESRNSGDRAFPSPYCDDEGGASEEASGAISSPASVARVAGRRPRIRFPPNSGNREKSRARERARDPSIFASTCARVKVYTLLASGTIAPSGESFCARRLSPFSSSPLLRRPLLCVLVGKKRRSRNGCKTYAARSILYLTRYRTSTTRNRADASK